MSYSSKWVLFIIFLVATASCNKDNKDNKGKTIIESVVEKQSSTVDRPPQKIVEDYKKRNSIISEFDMSKEPDVLWSKGDPNGDAITDWFLYDARFCGSRGCTGILYICSQDKQCCYAGDAMQSILNTTRQDLKCEIDYIEL